MERMGDAQKKQVTANEAQESGESFLQHLGPGLITGAADDDPSGIATYSEVGAQFGFGMLWTTLFSYPLMASIREICGRPGRITGMGIATVGVR
jgi:Mn2+/Fe2+ NRAMP family transporter